MLTHQFLDSKEVNRDPGKEHIAFVISPIVVINENTNETFDATTPDKQWSNNLRLYRDAIVPGNRVIHNLERAGVAYECERICTRRISQGQRVEALGGLWNWRSAPASISGEFVTVDGVALVQQLTTTARG